MEKLKLIINFIIAAAVTVIAFTLYMFLIITSSERTWSFYDKDIQVKGSYPTYNECIKDEVRYHEMNYGFDVSKAIKPFKSTCDMFPKYRKR